MKPQDWTYDGDVDLRHGGAFWTDDGDGQSGQVRVVRILPLSDQGGPDNVFRVEAGTLDVGDGERLVAALESVGMPVDGLGDEVTLADKVRAVLGHWGLEEDETLVVRIGAVDPYWNGRGPNPEPDRILPGNAHLRNFVASEFLAIERAPKDWGPKG